MGHPDMQVQELGELAQKASSQPVKEGGKMWRVTRHTNKSDAKLSSLQNKQEAAERAAERDNKKRQNAYRNSLDDPEVN